MSESILEHLASHLRAELGLHQELMRLAERKRDDIVGGDIAAFSAVLKEEQALMAKGQELGRLRARLMAACAAHLQCPVAELRLAQLLEQAPEPLRGRLQGLRSDLTSVLERLRQLNEHNLVLIRQSLAFVREVMHIVTGQVQTREGYGRDGGERPPQAGGGSLVNASC